MKHAFFLALRGEVRVAGPSPAFDSPPAKAPVTTTTATRVWKIAVDTLLEENVEFPIPASLSDVLRLRALPEITAFRQFVSKFVDSFVSGDEQEFTRVRSEVLSAMRTMKRLPYAKKH